MKLEMAKFLQDTIEESAVQRKMNSDRAAEFAQFMEKVFIYSSWWNNTCHLMYIYFELELGHSVSKWGILLLWFS